MYIKKKALLVWPVQQFELRSNRCRTNVCWFWKNVTVHRPVPTDSWHGLSVCVGGDLFVSFLYTPSCVHVMSQHDLPTAVHIFVRYHCRRKLFPHDHILQSECILRNIFCSTLFNASNHSLFPSSPKDYSLKKETKTKFIEIIEQNCRKIVLAFSPNQYVV